MLRDTEFYGMTSIEYMGALLSAEEGREVRVQDVRLIEAWRCASPAWHLRLGLTTEKLLP